MSFPGRVEAQYDATLNIHGDALYSGESSATVELLSGRVTTGTKKNFGENSSTYPVSVVVRDLDGDPLSGYVRVMVTDGHSQTSAVPVQVSSTGQSDGWNWTANLKVKPVWLAKNNTSAANMDYNFDAATATYPVEMTGQAGITITVEKWSGAVGSSTLEDSCTIAVTIDVNISIIDSGVSSFSREWDTQPVVYVYNGGDLPAGGREGLAPTYNTEFSGTISNDSEDTQNIRLAGVLPNGDAYDFLNLTIGPGDSYTLPSGTGLDLEPGQELYLFASGITDAGGDPILTFGQGSNDLSFSWAASEQQDVRLITHAELEGQTLTVLGGDTAQESIPIPAGTSSRDRSLSIPAGTAGSQGAVEMLGGSILSETINSAGQRVIVISAPSGTGSTTSTATAVSPSGQSTTVTTTTTSGGTQITTSSSDVVSPTAGSGYVPGSNGTSSSTGASSSTATATDEAAQELQRIRAEIAAAGALLGTGGTAAELAGDLSADLEGKVEGLQTALDGIDSSLSPGNLFGVNTLAPGAAGNNFGDTSSITVNAGPVVGAMTLDFDLGVVSFIRGFLLVIVSLAWFFMLLKIAKV